MKNFVFMVTLTLSLLLLLTMVAPALSVADDTTKVNCYKAISIHFEKDIEQINSFQSFSIKDSDVCFKNGDSPITNPDFEAKGVESNGSRKQDGHAALFSDVRTSAPPQRNFQKFSTYNPALIPAPS